MEKKRNFLSLEETQESHNLEIEPRLHIVSLQRANHSSATFVDVLTKIMKMRVGWAQLPEAILERLLQQLVLADFIRFSAVCVSWRSVTRKRNQRPRMQLPWLMLYDNSETDAIKFLSLSENRIYELKLPKRAHCWGAYEGWLMIEFLCKCRGNFLFNPMTSAKIRIPPLSSLPFSFQYMKTTIHKVAISSIPVVPSSLVVVCLYDEGELAFCTPRCREWHTAVDGHIRYVAIMFHGDYLYALDNQVQLWRVLHSRMHGGLERFMKLDINLPPGFKTEYYPPFATLYLAEHGEKIWLVIRTWREEGPSNRVQRVVTGLMLFELIESLSRWIVVELFGEFMLVLGSCYAKSFLANTTSGAIAERIYLTEDSYDLSDPDLEVAGFDPCKDCLLYAYNFENESLELYDQGSSAAEPLVFRNPPIWLSPDPWQRLESSTTSSGIFGALQKLCNLPGCLC